MATAVPAHAQSATATPIECCDDDFAGVETNLYLVLGGGVLLLATLLLVIAEATTPDPGSGDGTDE